MKKLAIGITGGIGSGKSTVSEFYETKGFHVIKADQIAKNIMQNDSEVIARIKSEFGNESYLENKLNSKFIAKIVFQNEQKLRKLNSIVHPATIKEISEEIKKYHISENIIFVEAALIFEAKMEELFDYILLVTADDEIRIERVSSRDKVSKDEIAKRIENQIPEKIKKSQSDFIIENNKSLDELKSKSEFFLKLFQTI
ncbi:MAG: dephospho-CoA kinase [Ignavibacteriae bacterium]|nr:dephospho-CoA kinase [Ignavibacteriota bacterium]